MQSHVSTYIVKNLQANGISRPIPSGGFRNILVTLTAKDSPSFTVKVLQSQSKYAIEDVTKIPSHYTIGTDSIVCFNELAGTMTITDYKGVTHLVNNSWQEVESILLMNGDDYDGNVGIVFSGANSVMEFELNTNRIEHFALEVSGYAGGTIDADVVMADNL